MKEIFKFWDFKKLKKKNNLLLQQLIILLPGIINPIPELVHFLPIHTLPSHQLLRHDRHSDEKKSEGDCGRDDGQPPGNVEVDMDAFQGVSEVWRRLPPRPETEFLQYWLAGFDHLVQWSTGEWRCWKRRKIRRRTSYLEIRGIWKK